MQIRILLSVALALACTASIAVAGQVLGPNNYESTAVGEAAVAVGGYQNSATGWMSFAAGTLAGAAHDGVFVWASPDRAPVVTSGAPTGYFNSTAPLQFLVKARGGVGINTANGPLGAEALASTMTLRSQHGDNFDTTVSLLANSTPGSNGEDYRGFTLDAMPNGRMYLSGAYHEAGTLLFSDPIMYVDFYHIANGGSSSYVAFNRSVSSSNKAGIFQVGTSSTNGNGAYLTAGGIWTNASSRAFKDDFSDIDTTAILTKVVSLPIRSWMYRNNHEEGRHIGPVAEDFYETFSTGTDATHIGSVDEAGVALAAIQGLNKKLEAENVALRHDKDQQVERLEKQIDQLTIRLSKLENRGN